MSFVHGGHPLALPVPPRLATATRHSPPTPAPSECTAPRSSIERSGLPPPMAMLRPHRPSAVCADRKPLCAAKDFKSVFVAWLPRTWPV